MKKAEFIQKVAEKANVTQKNTEAVVNAAIETITEALGGVQGVK